MESSNNDYVAKAFPTQTYAKICAIKVAAGTSFEELKRDLNYPTFCEKESLLQKEEDYKSMLLKPEEGFDWYKIVLNCSKKCTDISQKWSKIASVKSVHFGAEDAKIGKQPKEKPETKSEKPEDEKRILQNITRCIESGNTPEHILLKHPEATNILAQQRVLFNEMYERVQFQKQSENEAKKQEEKKKALITYLRLTLCHNVTYTNILADPHKYQVDETFVTIVTDNLQEFLNQAQLVKKANEYKQVESNKEIVGQDERVDLHDNIHNAEKKKGRGLRKASSKRGKSKEVSQLKNSAGSFGLSSQVKRKES
jgi:hypothetical protein